MPPFPQGARLNVPRNSQVLVYNRSLDLHWTPSGPLINGMLVWKSFISSISQTYGPIQIHAFTRKLILRGSSPSLCLLGLLRAQETCLNLWWQGKGHWDDSKALALTSLSACRS